MQRLHFQTRLSDVLDKFLFIAIFGLGAGCIVGLKYYGISAWIVTIAVIALLVVYVLICSITRVARIREDVVGDNAYYLGFLFTLVSLSMALWEVRNAADEELVASLLANFGIALGSTIAGIFLRVTVNQFRRDPIEIEREARQELIEVSGRLRSDLRAAALGFNSFREEMAQVLREGARTSIDKQIEIISETGERIAAEIGRIGDRIRADLDQPLATGRDGLVAATGELKAQGTAAASAFGQVADDFRGAGKRLTAAVDTVVSSLNTGSGQFADFIRGICRAGWPRHSGFGRPPRPYPR